jgi:penicillin-binding protein 2
LPKEEAERNIIISRIEGIFGKKENEIKNLLASANFFSFEPILIETGLDGEKALVLEAEINDLKGFNLEKNLQREYTYSSYLAHILGYVGRMNEQDIKDHPDFFATEIIGKDGIELQYDQILRTLPGRKETEVDAVGRIIKEVSHNESTRTKGLLLSIDISLQQKLYDELAKAAKKFGATNASAVALDPRNGNVLALVSLPGFDNNFFAKGISQSDYTELINDPNQPLFNRAVSGQYPPGSTIKPFIGAAALEEKIIKPKQTINDTGDLVIGNQYNPDVVYRFPDWKVHGPVDIYSAIAQSCDVYFYHIGGGYGDFAGLGVDRIEKYLKQFGFGGLTGIDLPAEKNGFVPNKTWKKEEKKENWFVGNTYHLSIGQGDLTVTPLQMAVFTAAIANGGTIWQPKIVDKIMDSEKNIINDIQPQGRAVDFISKSNLEIIRNAMQQVVLAGSAQYLKTLPIEAAGKTGTAQTVPGKEPNAWFTSFAPFENPEIALAILIEEGKEGSSAAVPVAKEVLEWYFNR